MIKDFIIGAVPLGLFLYLAVFHTIVLVVLVMTFGLALASYLIGVSIREDFFGDKNEQKEN